MYENFQKYTKYYLTYKSLFGKRYNKEKFINLIQTLPLNGIFDILSQLAFHEPDNERNDKLIVEHYVKFIDSVERGDNSSAKSTLKMHEPDGFIYSLQGLLTTWKWLLAHGNINNLSKNIDLDGGIFSAIYLCQIVSDYLYDENTKVPVEYELFRNAAFNSNVNVLSAVARASYIYIDFSQNRSLFNEKEYVDFNKDFKSYYGYTLKEDIAIILGILSQYVNKATLPIHTSWRANLKEAFSESILADKAKNVIESMSTNFSGSNKWAKETLEEPWNFTLFQKKPLFLLPDGTSFPIAPKLLYEKFFNSLFHKIRNIYPDENTNFQRFFGRPFEIYVSMEMKEAIKTSNRKYKFIPEFAFGKDNSKKSPDVMLKLGNKLLAIEAKSMRIKLELLIGNNYKSMDDELNRMIIDPIKQLDSCLSKLLLESNNKIDLNDITEVYLMVVTMGEFPTLPTIEERINEILKGKLNTLVKSVFHLDIEEYEYFCYLISRKKGKSIFRILDNKSTMGSGISFKNFLHSSHLPLRRPKIIKDRTESFKKEIFKILLQ